jgi:L,D-peptidoglycan transpeptidase YkuD (ErfK/YbiS/YcfS/YnhG family)
LLFRRQPKRIRIAAISARSLAASRGKLGLGILNLPCALGRGGRRAAKREGDGTTPFDAMQVVRVLYRADRVRRPRTALPVRPIRDDDGWCDAPGDRNYNRPVRHPYPASAERLWREDELYDIVVVLDYNLRPRIRGRGSAIFMHVARPDYGPTEGCIALRREHLQLLLERLTPGSIIRTGP